MKKKMKKEVVMEQPVEETPVMEMGAPVMPEPEQKVVVNCPKCGAGLYINSMDVVYMCPVCNNLMRVRISERIVKNVR